MVQASEMNTTDQTPRAEIRRQALTPQRIRLNYSISARIGSIRAVSCWLADIESVLDRYSAPFFYDGFKRIWVWFR